MSNEKGNVKLAVLLAGLLVGGGVAVAQMGGGSWDDMVKDSTYTPFSSTSSSHDDSDDAAAAQLAELLAGWPNTVKDSKSTITSVVVEGSVIDVIWDSSTYDTFEDGVKLNNSKADNHNFAYVHKWLKNDTQLVSCTNSGHGCSTFTGRQFCDACRIAQLNGALYSAYDFVNGLFSESIYHNCMDNSAVPAYCGCDNNGGDCAPCGGNEAIYDSYTDTCNSRK